MSLPVSTGSLQKIDRWIGIPVCFLLTLFRKLRELFQGTVESPPGPVKFKRILFVKFAEQGSTVLAHAAIRRAVEMAGPGNVFFVVFEENRFILDLMKLIPPENVVTIRTGNVIEMAMGALEALRAFRRLEIDAAVDLEFFSRSSAALTFLSGCASRVGFHTFFGEGPYRGDLMTHRLLYNPYLHTSQIFESMVEALSVDPKQLPTFGAPPPALKPELPRFVPEESEKETVQAMLSRETGEAGEIPLILLNPNASDLLPLRRWPTERYVELAARLLARYPDAWIGLTGAPSEAEAAGKVAASIGSKRCISLAGKTTLRELLVLYTLSRVLVTNDSGPAHFAALSPIRVVTLFGPETPSLFAALSPRTFPIWLGIACSPCVNAYNNRQSPCANNLCMKGITVEQVFTETCKAFESESK